MWCLLKKWRENILSNIRGLIQYGRENSKLDYKKEQYHKGKYQDLLKDIMSMANVPIEGKAYIIIGVKDYPNGTKEFFSIPKEEIVDQATFQQLVRENIEPNIDFSYFTFEYDGHLLGVIEINNCTNPPYMMKKDFVNLKKGECFVRQGSQQARITRRDLDEILNFRSKTFFSDKIEIGFNEEFNSSLNIQAVREIELPSEKAKVEIMNIINERERNKSFEDNFSAFSRLSFDTPKFYSPFQQIPYSEKSTESLERCLESLSEDYSDEDNYYIGEEKSEKINLMLFNRGDTYLEDVTIMLEIPMESGHVIDRIYDKPNSDGVYFTPAIRTISQEDIYPQVVKNTDKYIVQYNIPSLKHHQYTKAFDEDLRVFFSNDLIGKSFNWSYTIYAKNLPNPIEGELIIDIV